MAGAYAQAPDFAPGVYRGLKESEYRRAKGVSQTQLKLVLQETPRYAHINPRKASSGFTIGDGVHCLLLEPEQFNRRFVVYEGRRDKRTTAYKDFLESHKGKTVLSESEAYRIKEMVRRIGVSEKGKYMFAEGEAETSLFWRDPETGLLLKARPDWMDPKRDLILDVKTTTSVKLRAIRYTIRDYWYHFQQLHYSKGYHANFGRWPRWVFLFLDKGPEVFEYRWVTVNPSDVEYAAEQHAEALALWKECLTTGVWPSYPDRIETLEPCFNYERF